MNSYLIISKDGLVLDCVQGLDAEIALTRYCAYRHNPAHWPAGIVPTHACDLTAELVLPVDDSGEATARDAAERGE